MFPTWGFPGSSEGKESACNAGDPSSIPGLGRSAGEGIGYPSQYSWASLVAQMVKNPPTVRETWLRSLGWKAPLEKGVATHSSILGQRSLVGCSPWNSPGQNTGVGSRSLLQGIFPTQGIKPRSPALQVDSLPAEPPGKPTEVRAVICFMCCVLSCSVVSDSL